MGKSILLLLLVPTLAFAQDVDIQVRLAMDGIPGQTVKLQPQIQANQEVGTPDQPGYLNANESVPYIPTRWLCVTDVSHFAYGWGVSQGDLTSKVDVQWCHQAPGHSYHCLRTSGAVHLMTPMAFPPGEPVQLRVNNRAEVDVVVGLRLAGYLGAATGGRDLACR
jgi:hypothetical protein